MARLANRQSVPHWALVGNISAMTRGVGRSAERINKEVSSCYFQATRLITFVHDELIRFLGHQFVSEHTSLFENDDLSSDDIAGMAK